MMKLQWIFILCASLRAFDITGQNMSPGCDTLILDEHVQYVLNVHDKTLRDYLLFKKKIKPEFISDRDNLKILDTWICNESEVLIYDKNGQIIDIYLEKGEKSFNPEDFLMSRDTAVSFSRPLLYDDDNSPYGFIETDTLVSVIKKFEVKIDGKRIEIPQEAYSDLLFPNFCHTEIPIKPLQVFSTLNRDQIFIYLFGKLRIDERHSRQDAFHYSYMAKLIVDVKKGYQSRIVMRGENLCFYNWDNCPDFIGF